MKRILKKIHLYLALILFIPLIILGLTGSLLVVQDQINNFSAKENLSKVNEGEIPKYSQIIASAKKSEKIPENFVPSMLKMPRENGAPAIIRFTDSSNKKIFIETKIDPISLEILSIKNSDENKFFRIIHQLHANLLIDGDLGRNIVGALGLVMLFMGISGVILWWSKFKKYSGKAFALDFSSKGFRFHREMHEFFGIWFLVIFIIVSFTGVYLAFPKATGSLITSIFPGKDLRAANSIKVIPEGKKYLEIDAVENLVRSRFEEAKIISVNLPIKKDQPYKINLDSKTNSLPIVVFVDPWKAEIIEVQDPSLYTIGESIIAYQKLIHAGKSWGVWWKLLVFLTGFLPLLFSVTGIYMWILKKKNKKMKLQAAVS